MSSYNTRIQKMLNFESRLLDPYLVKRKYLVTFAKVMTRKAFHYIFKKLYEVSIVKRKNYRFVRPRFEVSFVNTRNVETSFKL